MKEINGHKIRYCELPFCEHCGEGHEPFGVEINDGGTQWCLTCYSCSYEITDEQENTIRKIELKEEIGWHQKHIWNLEKRLKEYETA